MKLMDGVDLIPMIDVAERAVVVNPAAVAHAQVNGRDDNRLLFLHLKDGGVVTFDLWPLVVATRDGGNSDLMLSSNLAETVASANPDTVGCVHVDNRERKDEDPRMQLLVHLIKDGKIIVLDLMGFLSVLRNDCSCSLDNKTIISC